MIPTRKDTVSSIPKWVRSNQEVISNGSYLHGLAREWWKSGNCCRPNAFLTIATKKHLSNTDIFMALKKHQFNAARN